jgi:putative transposase
MQADLLGLSRASLYYQPRPPSAEEVRLKHRIDELYTQCPFYGSRKIAAQLQREGMGINRKTVAWYMSEMGIAAIYPVPNLSKRNQKEGVYPYLLRHITSASPHHIWGIDITSIRLHAGWIYPGRRSWTGTRATWSVGNWIRRWSCPLCSAQCNGPWDKQCR